MSTPTIALDKKTHTYYLEDKKIPGFTEICKDMGIISDNPYYTEQVRREGIALHSWLLFKVQGKESKEPPHPSIAGRVRGIEKFIFDTGFSIAGGEVPKYDQESRFACTPDTWGHINGVSWVIDAKRGGKMPYHPLQTAAQRIALASNGFRAQKRGTLYLADDSYRLQEHKDPLDMLKWKAIVSAYYAKKSYI